ncbi:MAG: peptidase M3A and M3B thimet/oligopeptidase F [Candidatus Delongbacteria bacterium]|nr:peptidase M3A and M3B thimet/oligopeptidase F [Candidatus Delongbacteria bacterium]
MDKITKAINIGNKLQKTSKKFSELNWVKYTAGYDHGVEKAYDKIINILKSKKNFEVINELLQKDISPLDRRRVDLLKKGFEPYHLSEELNELDKRIQQVTMKLSGVNNKHRNKIDGKEVSLVEIFRILREDDSKANRKKAFHALSQVNKPLVDNGFIELVNLRKEYAKLAGANNFVEYKLKRAELDFNTFNSWKNDVRSMADKLKKTRNEYAVKYLKTPVLEPWDNAYLNSKIAPLMNVEVDMANYYKHIKDLYLKFGFDITKNNVTYDIFPRKNKSEWGYFFTIDPKVDTRILANVQNRYNEFSVLLHETGHALHDFSIDDEKDLLNDGISNIIAEGFANFFSSYLYDEMFYGNILDKKLHGKVKTQFKDLKKWNKINAMRAVGPILFDQELYKTDIKTLDDINQLKWKLDKELYNNDPYDGEPHWGYMIHHTTHPIMLHSYFMGDVTFEMMRKVFCKKENIKSINEKPKQFGKFMMKELIKPSGRYTFNELFKRVSGEEFSLKYLND